MALQFNDLTNRQGLLQDCEDILGLGATGISSNTTLKTTFTRYINQWYHKVVTIILDSQDDWDFDDTTNTDFPVATTPLVASQRDYSFPISLKILQIKRADVTYDGVTYYRVNPIDSSTTPYGLGNDSTTDGRYPKTSPVYDLKSNSFWLYPMAAAADVSAGAKLRIEFYRDIAEFSADGSDTTKLPGFDAPFHRMLSMGACYDYSLIKGLEVQNTLLPQLQDMEMRLRKYYGKKDVDIQVKLASQYINYE